MLTANRALDPKSRRLVAMGCACLSIGLSLQLLHPSTSGAQIALHLVTGFLLGLSVVLNVFAFIRMRRRRTGSTGPSTAPGE